MSYPAYYKNHDSSAFICLIDETKYMEVRRLNESHQISFGNSPSIHAMAKEIYLPARDTEFRSQLSIQVANMETVYELINN